MDNASLFDNSYARLPDRFFARQTPTPVAAPRLLHLNHALAESLGLDPAMLASPEGVEMLAGNRLPEGADPIAQAYAGHQFGGWVPQLGDGRAVLLGELTGPSGRTDIQLKGAGRTPFSRGGDGRAWLGPVLREYLVSEAMHAMGVPTTRALAAVATGENVMREAVLPGAVLTRTASSHIRVGTFQYFRARDDMEAIEALVSHVIDRHYPQAGDAWGLLDAVIEAQARLIAHWMGVGFIHGVMNTDNMSVAGETIDYGPCAFMDHYHPSTVFSSIDRQGRYAYGQQPQIAVWNLAQFATCLLPLLGERDAAIERATEMVNGFADRYQAHRLGIFRRKIGLTTAEDGDAALIGRLLDVMAVSRADFTVTFRRLAEGEAREVVTDIAAFDDWAEDWRTRLARDGTGEAAQRDTMLAQNPAVIPRNHHMEAAIQAAVAGDLSLFEAMHQATLSPFTPHPTFSTPPEPGEEIGATFCGT